MPSASIAVAGSLRKRGNAPAGRFQSQGVAIVSPDESGSKSQKIKLGIALAFFVAAGAYGWSQWSGADVTSISTDRAHLCSAGCPAFEYTIRHGDIEPIECAHCGKKTGYQAEKCYWTKDASGKWAIKDEPTFVLLKRRVNRETDEKTYCKDCGREVVGHNPRPTAKEIAKANSK